MIRATHFSLKPESSELSPAEIKIYDLAIQGLTRDEIASKACRTRRTVNFHFDNIFRKLGVGTHAKLVARHYMSQQELAA